MLCKLPVVAALALGACSSTKTVDIDSKPTGAVIYVNGEKKGVTRSPISLSFQSGQRVLIQLSKNRYKPIFQYWTIDEVPDKKVFSLEAD